MLAACTPPTAEQVFVVDTVVDAVDANVGDGVCETAGGSCSLRAAVMEGNADANITEVQLSADATYVLALPGPGEDASATGDLDLTERTYLRAPPGATATIEADGTDRIIDVIDGDFHYLEGLRLSDGAAPGDGGAILVRSGLVGVEDVYAFDNAAGGRGGAIAAVGGRIWIENTTIANNTAAAAGGGIYAEGLTWLDQVTVDNNSGVDNSQVTGSGSADVRSYSSTISGSSVAGSSVALSLTAGTANLTNTILAGSPACAIAPAGNVISHGGNIATDGTCGLGAGDQSATAPMLHPLADNGGPAPTRLPAIGSSAIDAIALGSDRCVAPVPDDARGQPRAIGAGCDAGAIEVQPGESTGIDCTAPPTLGPGAQLQHCDLADLVAPFVNLSGANLSAAIVSDAVLTNANLAGAIAVDADFTSSYLTGATLIGADLSGADFSDADLEGANLSGATLTGTIWAATICPDGSDSDDNGGTCANNL